MIPCALEWVFFAHLNRRREIKFDLVCQWKRTVFVCVHRQVFDKQDNKQVSQEKIQRKKGVRPGMVANTKFPQEVHCQ